MRARRLELKLSQTDLAEALGLTYQQIQKYEIGRNRVSPSRLMRAAQYLQVTPSYFFDAIYLPMNGADASIAQVNEFVANKHGQALIRAFQRIKSKQTRRGIVDLVAELAGTLH